MQLFSSWTHHLELEVVVITQFLIVIIDAQLPSLDHTVNVSGNCVESSKLKPKVQRVVEKEPGHIVHQHNALP